MTSALYTSDYDTTYSTLYAGTYEGTYETLYTLAYELATYTGTVFVNYASLYLASYETDFTNAYEEAYDIITKYSGTFISEYAITTYESDFEGLIYQESYEIDYELTYTSDYLVTYQRTYGTFDGSYDLEYQTDYLIDYVLLSYEKSYAGPTVGYNVSYGGDFTVSYLSSDYSANFNVLYNTENFDISYAGPTYDGTTKYIGNYLASYTSTDYERTYGTPLYEQNYSHTYQRDYDSVVYDAGPYILTYELLYDEPGFGFGAAGSYTATYSGLYVSQYLRDYTGTYIKEFTAAEYNPTVFSDYSAEYGSVYDITYETTYTQDYILQFGQAYNADTYTTDFILPYEQTYETSGQYQETFTSVYQKAFEAPFIGSYSGSYAVEYIGTYESSYEDDEYTTEYTGSVETPYELIYDVDYSTNYSGEFDVLYEGDFVSSYAKDYTGVKTELFESPLAGLRAKPSVAGLAALPEKLFTVYMPRPFELEITNNGNFNYKNLIEYFKTIGTIPAQLKLQLFEYRSRISAFDQEAQRAFADAIKNIEKTIETITGIFPKVFDRLKNWEHEMEYKVREFMKNIELWLVQRMIRALTKIPFVSTFLSIFNFPIPGLGLRILDYFIDKENFKKVLKEKYKQVEKAIGAIDPKMIEIYAERGIEAIEYKIEEIYNRIVQWIKNILNVTVIDIVNAIWSFLTKIPIIGSIIKALGILIDPSISLNKIFDAIWDAAVAKYKAIKKQIEDIYKSFKKKDGKGGSVKDSDKKLIVKLKDMADKLLDGLIDQILNIPIPLFGTVGKVMGINWKEEVKKFKVHIKENVLVRVKEAWADLMDKIRRFFSGAFLKKFYDLILSLPSMILKMFPILGTILKAIEMVIDICTGRFPVGTAMKLIFPQAFNLMKLVYSILPDNIRVEYTKYGYEGIPIRKTNMSMGDIIDKANIKTDLVPAGVSRLPKVELP